jgi:hypothetical protein
VSLEVMIRGTCDRARLLDLVENFTLFSEHKAGLVKIIGQNQQFLANFTMGYSPLKSAVVSSPYLCPSVVRFCMDTAEG